MPRGAQLICYCPTCASTFSRQDLRRNWGAEKGRGRRPRFRLLSEGTASRPFGHQKRLKMTARLHATAVEPAKMTARLHATTVEPSKTAENDGWTADGGRPGPANGHFGPIMRFSCPGGSAKCTFWALFALLAASRRRNSQEMPGQAGHDEGHRHEGSAGHEGDTIITGA